MEYLDKLLVLRTAQGDFIAAGRCISYCEAPTVTIKKANGTLKTWRADLCSVLTDDPAVVNGLIPSLTPIELKVPILKERNYDPDGGDKKPTETSAPANSQNP